MFKHLVLIFSILLLVVSSTGCSFIKEKLLNQSREDSKKTDESEDKEKEKEQKRQESGPIPVNPQHS